MATPLKYDADGSDGSSASGQEPSFAAELRKTLNTIPAYTWYALPSGTLTFVNDAYANYLGLAKDDSLRLGVEVDVPWDTHINLVHPDDHEETLRVGAECNRTGTAGQAAFRIRNAEGKYRWFLSRLEPLRARDGTLLYWIGINLDIEELKRAEHQGKVAEEKIREQEMELRQILNLTPQIIAVFGPHYRERLFINRMALDYFGLTVDEWRDAAPGALGHPDDSKRVQPIWDRALSSGSAFESEGRLRKSDGTYRWFLIRYNPVRDEEGKVLRWYAACADIDDLKRAEERLQQENVALREEIDRASMFEEIVGTSPALQAVLSRISKVAPTDSTVLITGETGTGKELVARAIHRRSKRASRSFVSVNCAAIPRDLIASELFGHEKGAFTGALQRRLGRFELAEGGTIFLDEVGELSPDTQVALLRVLQEREFERVGGTQSIRADVRVIAATNRDLKAAVAKGTYREDLYYRLNVFPVEMPPLRARRADIPLLVEYFVDRYARKAGKSIRRVDKKTLQSLQSYPWPGNIRELQNVIERSVIVCETETFEVDESWLSQRLSGGEPESKPFLSEKVAATEKEIIEEALRESRGRIAGPSGAAARLGIARSTLDSKIQTLNIDKHRFKAASAT
jgi:formate hydrogenlyase transcriptional activator